MKFKRGTEYTRREINDEIGGSTQSCFLLKDGHVVGICFVKKKNPDGPKVILVGRGPQKEKFAPLLARQPDAIPVFVKNEKNHWEYLGLYKGERYDAFPHKQYVDKSGRTDVAGTLFLSSAD